MQDPGDNGPVLSHDIFCDAALIQGSLSSTSREELQGKPGIKVLCGLPAISELLFGVISCVNKSSA